jgi:hypothetical protein
VSTCLDTNQRGLFTGVQPSPATPNDCQQRAREERRKEYTMRMLHEVHRDELVWVRPKWSRFFFELRAGETVVATLAWTGGSRAAAECAGAQYRFSREGWLRPRILVREGATGRPTGAGAPEETVATFVRRRGGGTLTFPDGRTFLWRKLRVWTSERVWADVNETVLVRFNPVTRESPVTVSSQPQAAELAELPLLILLGQYLVVLAAQDAAAAGTAATVAVIASS